MTVYNNMAYALKLRKVPKDEIDKRVREARTDENYKFLIFYIYRKVVNRVHAAVIDLVYFDELEKAVKSVFTGNLKMLLVTDGGKGAKMYLADGREFSCKGYKVKAIDTTGAGDSFFGGVKCKSAAVQTDYVVALPTVN